VRCRCYTLIFDTGVNRLSGPFGLRESRGVFLTDLMSLLWCTLDTYTQAIMPAKRAAQSAVLSTIPEVTGCNFTAPIATLGALSKEPSGPYCTLIAPRFGGFSVLGVKVLHWRRRRRVRLGGALGETIRFKMLVTH